MATTLVNHYTRGYSGSTDNLAGFEWFRNSFVPSQSTKYYMNIYRKESTGTKRLSKKVEKILSDIDSGKVKMVIQTADEFIADMTKDLAKTKRRH